MSIYGHIFWNGYSFSRRERLLFFASEAYYFVDKFWHWMQNLTLYCLTGKDYKSFHFSGGLINTWAPVNVFDVYWRNALFQFFKVYWRQGKSNLNTCLQSHFNVERRAYSLNKLEMKYKFEKQAKYSCWKSSTDQASPVERKTVCFPDQLPSIIIQCNVM